MAYLPPPGSLLSQVQIVVLRPGGEEYFQLQRGGKSIDTTGVAKFAACKFAPTPAVVGGLAAGPDGYCLSQLEFKVSHSGENPPLRIKRLKIRIELDPTPDVEVALRVPDDKFFLGSTSRRNMAYSIGATAGGQALAGCLTASLSYGRTESTEFTDGITINYAPSGKNSTDWDVRENKATHAGIDRWVPVALVIKHPPSSSFTGKLTISVKPGLSRADRASWSIPAWLMKTHVQEYIVEVDGIREAGPILPEDVAGELHRFAGYSPA
ncbi:hypothetical protein RQP46_004019 [Phenoliferia psychrophenolica]